MLGENDAGAEAGAVRAIVAFSYTIETVAGRDDPRVGRRTLQVFAEIFEDGGVFWRKGSEIVDGLVDAGGEACGRDVMAQDSAIYYLCEKGGLRNQLSHQVRDILLPLGGKRLLIARTAAKRNDDNCSLLGGNASQSDWVLQQRASQRHGRAGAQELTPAPGELASKFLVSR